jgi:hypothetical protein
MLRHDHLLEHLSHERGGERRHQLRVALEEAALLQSQDRLAFADPLPGERRLAIGVGEGIRELFGKIGCHGLSGPTQAASDGWLAAKVSTAETKASAGDSAARPVAGAARTAKLMTGAKSRMAIEGLMISLQPGIVTPETQHRNRPLGGTDN